MSDFSQILAARPQCATIQTSSAEALEQLCTAFGTAVFTTGTWPTANLAILYPFTVVRAFTVQAVGWLNGSVVSGNVDCGVYDMAGNRKLSCGTQAQTGTSVIQTATCTKTVLPPGRWYAALSMDNTTGNMANFKPLAEWLRSEGVQQAASAFVLPSSVTLANPANAYLPWFGLFSQTVI